MVRQHHIADAKLRIGESRDSQVRNCAAEFDAEPVIRPHLARTGWHRPGM